MRQKTYLERKLALPPQVAGWYEGKDFTADWTTHKLAPWFDALDPFQGKLTSILEIGSWEGRSAIAFLEILPMASITCVDTFGGSANHLADPELTARLPLLEGRFDRNTAAYHSRIRKMVGRSVAVMDDLTDAGRQFDIVYIDASHRRDDVLADSILAWRLLKVGGLMMWDDLRFKLEWEPAERPADALLLFCAMFGECMEEIHRGMQLLARKTAEWPHAYRIEPKPKSSSGRAPAFKSRTAPE